MGWDIKEYTTFLWGWEIIFSRGTEPRRSPHKEKQGVDYAGSETRSIIPE